MSRCNYSDSDLVVRILVRVKYVQFISVALGGAESRPSIPSPMLGLCCKKL